MRQRTPKTLNQAISNAFHAFEKSPSESVSHLRKLIKDHVQDWIRNASQPVVMELENSDRKSPFSARAWKAMERLTGKKF